MGIDSANLFSTVLKFAIIEVREEYLKFVSKDLLVNNHVLTENATIYYTDKNKDTVPKKFMQFMPRSRSDIKDFKFRYYWLLKSTNPDEDDSQIPSLLISHNGKDTVEKAVRVYIKHVSGTIYLFT